MPQVADYVLVRLREWGIHRLYGYPRDGINGFLGAFDRAGGIRSSSRPGAIHLLNGLYDAKLDHQPVVALVGSKSGWHWARTTSRRWTWSPCSRTCRSS
jgi:pyruvate dehydrogenase (quinone)